jgi:hypothetical protein
MFEDYLRLVGSIRVNILGCILGIELLKPRNSEAGVKD